MDTLGSTSTPDLGSIPCPLILIGLTRATISVTMRTEPLIPTVNWLPKLESVHTRVHTILPSMP
jgi:hypothetical protein